uniref:Uncharacterized protein n=1 Tax=Cucumis melo TaxID=3656 RepID=A0A9I9E8Z4_CUCME
MRHCHAEKRNDLTESYRRSGDKHRSYQPEDHRRRRMRGELSNGLPAFGSGFSDDRMFNYSATPIWLLLPACFGLILSAGSMTKALLEMERNCWRDQKPTNNKKSITSER